MIRRIKKVLGDEAALPLLESLDPWIQNKTIQKAIESYRIKRKEAERIKKQKEEKR